MTRSQVLILVYLSYTFTAYGFALFINGIGKRVVPSRPLLTDEQAEKVPDIVRLMAVTVNPMFTLASGRVLAMVGILAVMYWRKELPPSTERFTRRHLIPVAIGMANAGGYVFYMMLCSLNGIALWAGLSSVYVVCPVAYGLFVRHERRSPKKLFGILVCLGAAIMLGMAQSLDAKGADAARADGLQSGSANATATLDGEDAESEAAGPSPLHASWFLKLVLFLLCIFSWGFCDGAASYINKGPNALHMFSVCASTMCGFAIVAWLCAGVSFFITSLAPAATIAVPIAPLPAAKFWGGQLLMLVAQVAGVTAWYCMVKLGSIGEASGFLPVLSLYTIFTGLLGVVFLGESMNALGWAGMFVAAMGVLFIATAGMGDPAVLEAESAGADATRTRALEAGIMPPSQPLPATSDVAASYASVTPPGASNRATQFV